MSDHGLGGVFSPSEDHGTGEKQDSESKGTTDFEIPLASDHLSAWFDNAPTFSTNSREETHEGYAITLDGHSSFDGPSSLPSGQMTPGEIPCLVGGQSSGTKRMDGSDSLEMQTKETTLQEDGEKETSDGCRPQKRTRSAEIHNLNERIRRQKLKDKMKVLREIIPNCNKRDKSSTLDDAINYIKTLQYQLQMVSTGVGHSPSAMMLQVNFPPFLQTAPPRGGMEYAIGMGIPNMHASPLVYPSHYEPLDPCLMPPSSAPALPRSQAQNSGDLFESSYASSFPSSGSQSLMPGDTTSSQGHK